MEVFNKLFKTKVSKMLSNASTKAKDSLWIILLVAFIFYLLGYKMATDLAVRVSGR